MGINEVYIIYIDTYFAGNYVIGPAGELSSMLKHCLNMILVQKSLNTLDGYCNFHYPQDFSPFEHVEVDCLTNMIIWKSQHKYPKGDKVPY